MLAKHETPMKDRMTIVGLVPAKLKSLVIKTRSMFVLLNAEAMVNPPIKSMIVGENICWNTNLRDADSDEELVQERTHLRSGFVSRQHLFSICVSENLKAY